MRLKSGLLTCRQKLKLRKTDGNLRRTYWNNHMPKDKRWVGINTSCFASPCYASVSTKVHTNCFEHGVNTRRNIFQVILVIVLQLAAKVVETLSVTKAIWSKLWIPPPPSMLFGYRNNVENFSLQHWTGEGGWRGKFMAVLSVKQLFFRRDCVFLQSVSTILQLIVALLTVCMKSWAFAASQVNT